jgi:hypothetical protein
LESPQGDKKKDDTDEEPKLTISFKNGATFDDLKECIYGVGENLGEEESDTEGHAEEIQNFAYTDRPEMSHLQEQNYVRNGGGGVLLGKEGKGKGGIQKLEGKEGDDNGENNGNNANGNNANGNNDNDIAYLPTRADTHPDLLNQYSSDEAAEWME